MDEQSLAFVLQRDQLQGLPLRLDPYGLGVYCVNDNAPLAQGGYGTVYRCYKPTIDGLKRCVYKQILLTPAGASQIEGEYDRLCAVSNITGVVKCMQPPVYSGSYGFLVTECVMVFAFLHTASDLGRV